MGLSGPSQGASQAIFFSGGPSFQKLPRFLVLWPLPPSEPAMSLSHITSHYSVFPFKYPSDFTDPTWKIQDNLLIQRSVDWKLEFHLQPLIHVYRFPGLGWGHLTCVGIICLPHKVCRMNRSQVLLSIVAWFFFTFLGMYL